MNHKFNLMLTIISGYFFKFRYRRQHPALKKSNVIVYFPQQIGDGILFLDTLNQMSKKYINKYNVLFLARPSVNSFLVKNMHVNRNIKMIDVDVNKIKSDYKYVTFLSNKYMHNIAKFIVPNYSITGLLLALRLKSEKVCMISNLSYTSSRFIRYIYCRAFNRQVFVPQDMMELMRYKVLLRSLAILPNPARVPIILPHVKTYISPFMKKYCIIGIGSSLSEKIWYMKRFAQIIRYITMHTVLDIYICGDSNEKDLQEEIKQYLKYNERVKFLVGKTTMTEWVNLIQHARFVIGNDSATVHIAAACNVPSICLCGSYDKNQFFPYVVECPSNTLPIVIRKKMNCGYCRVKGNHIGAGNWKCRQHIRKRKKALCIDQISVADVINEINKLVSSNS